MTIIGGEGHGNLSPGTAGRPGNNSERADRHVLRPGVTHRELKRVSVGIRYCGSVSPWLSDLSGTDRNRCKVRNLIRTTSGRHRKRLRGCAALAIARRHRGCDGISIRCRSPGNQTVRTDGQGLISGVVECICDGITVRVGRRQLIGPFLTGNGGPKR